MRSMSPTTNIAGAVTLARRAASAYVTRPSDEVRPPGANAVVIWRMTPTLRGVGGVWAGGRVAWVCRLMGRCARRVAPRT